MTASTCIIKLSPNEIIYDTEKFEAALDPQFHITRDIYDDISSIIIGSKKSYLLYGGKPYHGERYYKLKGYCHSMSFAMDVIRSMMAKNVDKEHKYEIHIKRIPNGPLKLYLFQVNEGWLLYNSYVLLDKFKIVEVPKIEMKYTSKVMDD